MALNQIVLVLLFFNLSPTPCNCLLYGINSFRAEPSSNPNIGSSIKLTCTSSLSLVEILGLNDGYEFHLSKDGHNLTRCGEFLDEEFGNRIDTRVNFDRVDSVHGVDLTIASISRSDSGTYTCGLYDRSDLLDERSVTINVLYYPSGRFPICSFKTSPMDNNVTLSCFSETGNPPVSLIWTTTDNNTLDIPLTTTASVSNQNGFVTSVISLKYSQIRIADTFTCRVTSSEFYFTNNCIIPAESTLSLEIRPSRLSTDINEGADFNCVLNVPNDIKPLKWLWITEPQIPSSRRFSVGSAFSINSTLAEDNGTLISCYALFENYWLLSNAELLVAFNQTESRNETVNKPRGTHADSNIGWIGALVVMTIVCAAIVGIAICLYRKVRQNETSYLSQRDVSVRVQSVVQPQVNQANVNDTPDDEYQDLNVEQNIMQEEYTELNMLSAGKDQESNNGLGNRNMQKDEEELCYDYAETNLYARPNEESRVYGNI